MQLGNDGSLASIELKKRRRLKLKYTVKAELSKDNLEASSLFLRPQARAA